MAIPSIKKIKPEDADVRFIQDAYSDVLSDIRRKEILDGLVIRSVSIVSGTPKIVDHGLGRQIQGWVTIRKSSNANVWDTPTSLETRQLKLNASANVTIDLWVF